MGCTDEDHDTTDMFCGACGTQLDEPAQCDWCERGQHNSDGSPFCQCCGVQLIAVS